MIPLYDRIIELRAELTSCYLSGRERAAIGAELEQALAQRAERNRAGASDGGD